MAWTRLFHAHFNKTIGDKYFYKKGKRFEIIDGERKAWELKTCVVKFGKLSQAIAANITFFIGLRNKIEHRHIDERELDTLVFGECQAFLYNYENTLIELFGEEFAVSENLAYSLQFSRIRTDGQEQSNKQVVSDQIRDIKRYVENYRTNLSDEVFSSQEYSIKLLQIPKVSNTDRKDLAIEFVNWNVLDEDDKANYEKLLAIVKDKIVVREVVNSERFKPGKVLSEVKRRTGHTLTQFDHLCLYYVFSVRPIKGEGQPREATNSRYCSYDLTHEDYVYQQEWIDFLCNLLVNQDFDIQDARKNYKARTKLTLSDYE